MKNKVRLTESQFKRIVKESVLKIVKEIAGDYPAGAADDPRAPYNQPDPDFQTTTVTVVAYYDAPEFDDGIKKTFQVQVTVPGVEYSEPDEDGGVNTWFEPDDDIDYEELVDETGQIPTMLDGKYPLEYIEVVEN